MPKFLCVLCVVLGVASALRADESVIAEKRVRARYADNKYRASQTMRWSGVLEGSVGSRRYCGIAHSSTAKRIVALGVDGHMVIWEGSAKTRHAMSIATHDTIATAVAVALDPSGDTAYVADIVNIFVCDLSTRTVVRNRRTFGGIKHLRQAPGGKQLLSAGIRTEMFDLSTLRRTASFPKSPLKINGWIDFSPDGALIAQGARQGVLLWTLEQGAPGLFGVMKHPSTAPKDDKSAHADETIDNNCGLSFLDAKTVVTASYDGAIRFWDIEEKSVVRSTAAHKRDARVYLAACPSKDRFATAGQGKVLRLWDSNKRTEIDHIALAAWPTALCMTKDRIYVGHADGDTHWISVFDYR